MKNEISPILKRDLLYGIRKSNSNELSAYANTLMNVGSLSDASDFAFQAGNQDLIGKIKDTAVAEGNTFLFLKCARYLKVDQDLPAIEKELRKCGENAENTGLFRYALLAFEKLGDTNRVDSIKEQISSDGDIVAAKDAQVFIPAHTEEISEDDSEE